ncbi:MAG: BREX system P-loop protein BrxC, partial [Methylotenera sp.]|nr:BREX system P-loop protein BrxC [Flavobacterium sp.]
MKNKDLFNLNPDENNLLNDGVVEINTAKDDAGYKIIRYELKTFVCEGEYQNGMQRILSTFLRQIDNKQPAVWVSGFFGSGKSHFVKMLGYLWEDLKFPNDETARMMKPLPKEVNDLFVELERKQNINGRLAIAGTLKDFPSKDIRNSFLQLFLNKLGLPSQYHFFKFIYWLKQEGIHDELKALVEAQGKDFKKEYENLFVSSTIAKALLELKPEFAENEAKVRENFKATFVRQETISREQFISTIKTEILPLFYGNKIPLTIIVLDEVQQFIGGDGDKSIDVQELAQDLSSNFEGKFLLIGTGQNALTDTAMLQKLMARFTVPVNFSDTDVDTVTRKTVLEKKPSVINEVKTKLEAALGEISRNLNGSEYGYVTDDKKNLVADYPILPSTRKFWKKVLNAIDTAGTSGQLRSQLRIVDESIKNVAQKDLGAIVPADLIFEQKQPQLIQNARLLNETNNLIEERKSRGGDSLLEGRILSAVFLIDLLPDGKDRLKSNENTIADLLIDDISKSSDTFRTKVNELIKKLVEEKILMPIGDEYKLQTKVGSEWEQEFAKQFAKFNNSGEDQIQNYRKERIVAFFKDKTKTINITQGVSKIV